MKLHIAIVLLLLSRVTPATTIELGSQIQQAAHIVGVPSDLLTAICKTESSLRPIKSIQDGVTKSYGICQVKLETAQWMDKVYKHKHKATEAILHQPYTNALYAAKYLRLQYLRYHGNWVMAITAYNKGHASPQDRTYFNRVRKVLK